MLVVLDEALVGRVQAVVRPVREHSVQLLGVRPQMTSVVKMLVIFDTPPLSLHLGLIYSARLKGFGQVW